jgi:hypothetical protein
MADSMIDGDTSVETITGTIGVGGADVQHTKVVLAYSAEDVCAITRV